MKHFTIETETNNITVHMTAKIAETVPNAEHFSTETALASLAANWPVTKLVEIYNSLPGTSPVKKFTDRATAVSRVWKALQTFAESAPAGEEAESQPAPEVAAAAVEEPGETPLPETVPTTPFEPAVSALTPDVAPEVPPAPQKATRKQKAPKATETGPREGSKTSQVIAMLKREGGAMLEEIMAAMQWQKHTTRAMLSAGGSLTRNHGLTIISEKVGERRTYSIKA